MQTFQFKPYKNRHECKVFTFFHILSPYLFWMNSAMFCSRRPYILLLLGYQMEYIAMFQLTHAAALCTDPPGQLRLSNCQPIDLYARNIQTFTQYSNKNCLSRKDIWMCQFHVSIENFLFTWVLRSRFNCCKTVWSLGQKVKIADGIKCSTSVWFVVFMSVANMEYNQ